MEYKFLRNGEEINCAGGGVGELSTRYNEENDTVQILKNGEWIDWKQAYTERCSLYETSANEGEFQAYKERIAGYYAALPTVTFSTTMKITLSNADWYGGSAISKPIDFTRYSKLHYYATASYGLNDTYHNARLFITDRIQQPIVATEVVVFPAGSKENTIDVTNLVGEYYVGINLQVNGKPVSVSINEMYLE